MFIASKLLSFMTQPLAWVALLLLAALLCMTLRRRCGPKLVALALALLLLLGWEPLPDALLRPLETQSAAVPADASLQAYVGVVVLGGVMEPAYVWQGHAQPGLNDAAERMTEALRLLQRQPHLRLLFSGGEGELMADGTSEAERARIFFQHMGLDGPRMMYESASRTTYENAILSARLPGVDPAQPWLLMTSAWHMPRALATFRRAGWNVTPYAVDFRAGSQTPWSQYSLLRGSNKWQLALHEWVGWLAYRLSGRA
jgi:uncharacterized SAM-binding protein YcdF (DUF218 family)